MRVLFLGEVGSSPVWYDGVLRACGNDHEVSMLNPREPISEQFAGVDCVVDQGGSVGTREMMDAARKNGVKFWQVLGTGLDHVDVAYLLECGFLVANCPGQYSAIALAEHALFLMLYLAKQFPASQEEFNRRRRAGLVTSELCGKTLGLVGLGASGQELARRGTALGMKVLAVDTMSPSPKLLEELNAEFLGGPDQLETLLRRSDVASLHVPLLPTTKHIIDRKALGWMQPHAMLINVARGGLVDAEAVLESLQKGRLGGAGLDVFEDEPINPNHPLLGQKNVVATPHLAGTTHGTARRRGEAAAVNISRVANGMLPLHQITECGA